MLRIYMTDGTEEELDKGTEKWSCAKFNVPGRDDENIFISPHGMSVDGVGFLTWQDFYALTAGIPQVRM